MNKNNYKISNQYLLYKDKTIWKINFKSEKLKFLQFEYFVTSCFLFYVGKIVPEITHLDIKNPNEISFFGKYLRTPNFSLCYDGRVINLVKNEWKKIKILGNDFLVSYYSILYRGEPVFREFNKNKERFNLSKIISKNYLFFGHGLIYKNFIVEECLKQKTKFFAKDIGLGYIQTPFNIIWEGQKILKIKPSSKIVFICDNNIPLSKRKFYLFVGRSLVYNGKIIHKFDRKETIIRIFSNGEYILSKYTIIYNHFVLTREHINHTLNLALVSYVGNSYLSTYKKLLYKGRIICDFPDHAQKNITLFIDQNFINVETRDVLDRELFTQFFYGDEELNGNDSEIVKGILIRENEIWKPKKYHEYSEEFKFFVRLLLLCNYNSKNNFSKISLDVLLYKIIPFVFELDVFILKYIHRMYYQKQEIYRYNNNEKDKREREIEASGYYDKEILFRIHQMEKCSIYRGKKMAKKTKLREKWIKKKERRNQKIFSRF